MDELREVWAELRAMGPWRLALELAKVVLGLALMAGVIEGVMWLYYRLGVPDSAITPTLVALLAIWMGIVFRRELTTWLRGLPGRIRWWGWVWSQDHPPRDAREIADLEMARDYLESEGQR